LELENGMSQYISGSRQIGKVTPSSGSGVKAYGAGTA